MRYGLTKGGLTVGLATQYLRSEGFTGITADQADAELRYLADPGKALMRISSKVVSPEIARWETTAVGRDFLALAGMEEL